MKHLKAKSRASKRTDPLSRAARARNPSQVTRVKKLSRQLQRALATEREPLIPASKDPHEAAAVARLRYVSPDQPGLRRLPSAKGFRYVDDRTGRAIKDATTLARIKALGIPPAWRDVWVCADPEGHIQALGIDARGRKQYRYHARWREVRDRTKFGRMILFAQALPKIRAAVARDLALPGLPREKVLATLVLLLSETGIRVGSEEYARDNGHYGLTTLLGRHVAVKGERLRFRFKGKSGKDQDVGMRNARVARVIRRCLEIPGQRLFQYVDGNGQPVNVESEDVNAYIHAIASDEFTAKDFRTWVGTVTAAASLFACACPDTAKETRLKVLAAIDVAAARLGNTRTICKKSYIHPAVLQAFEEGRMPLLTKPRREQPHGLDPIEQATLRLLKQAARPAKASAAKPA